MYGDEQDHVLLRTWHVGEHHYTRHARRVLPGTTRARAILPLVASLAAIEQHCWIRGPIFPTDSVPLPPPTRTAADTAAARSAAAELTSLLDELGPSPRLPFAASVLITLESAQRLLLGGALLDTLTIEIDGQAEKLPAVVYRPNLSARACAELPQAPGQTTPTICPNRSVRQRLTSLFSPFDCANYARRHFP